MPGHATPCRCGRDTPTHLCHANGYTCPNPGTPRWYVTNPMPGLAGAMPKVVAADTVACDEHWAEYLATGRTSGRS